MKIKRLYVTFSCIFIMYVLASFALAGDLRVVCFKVGSGDSTLFVFPTDKVMLIDTGPQSRTRDTVIPFLQRHGIKHLDYLVTTHVHNDHDGGVEDLYDRGFANNATTRWDQNTFKYGDTFSIEGTQWFIYNVLDHDFHTSRDVNENSLSYRFSYNGFVYSGAGDEGTKSMDRFRKQHPNLVRAHVRYTAHHLWGPISESFIRATDAYLYIVSSVDRPSKWGSYVNIVNNMNKSGRKNEIKNTAHVGNIYVRVKSGSDWSKQYFSASKTHIIPGFYSTKENKAQYVSQSVPKTMRPGESAQVIITMKNTGESTWSDGAKYHLGSQNPQDNRTWGTPRVKLINNVNPGVSYAFKFTIKAPAAPGTYNFQWKMVQDGVQWFGGTSANVQIEVKAGPPTPTPIPTPTPVPTPTPTPNGDNVLAAGQEMAPNEKLTSLDGKYKLYFQGDGNLVLRDSAGKARWSSGSHGKDGVRLDMQGDGNLVIYTGSGSPVWSSKTAGSTAVKLVLRNTGYIVLEKADGAVVWSEPEGPLPTPTATVMPTPTPTPTVVPTPSPTPTIAPTPTPTIIPTPTPAGNDTLTIGQELALNQRLTSADGKYRLYFQGDGNLVLRDSAGKALWSTGTHGKGGARVKLQSDANLVMYTGGGKALWSSKTVDSGAVRLVIKNTGVIKLETAGGTQVWAAP